MSVWGWPTFYHTIRAAPCKGIKMPGHAFFHAGGTTFPPRLTKKSKTPKKVTGDCPAITGGNPAQLPLPQGFAHYPHSFPHRYVNTRRAEKLENRAHTAVRSLFAGVSCITETFLPGIRPIRGRILESHPQQAACSSRGRWLAAGVQLFNEVKALGRHLRPGSAEPALDCIACRLNI